MFPAFIVIVFILITYIATSCDDYKSEEFEISALDSKACQQLQRADSLGVDTVTTMVLSDFDSAWVDDGSETGVVGKLVTGSYNGADGVVLGDGDLTDPTDNYQNAVWNHLYFYSGLEGDNPNNSSAEADKIRLGVEGHVVYPKDCGPARALAPAKVGLARWSTNRLTCGTRISRLMTSSRCRPLMRMKPPSQSTSMSVLPCPKLLHQWRCLSA